MAGEERSVKVKIDHVEKIFDTKKGPMVALNGVDLDIKENEFICVVGPSGCGKSTLLNIIAGLLPATSGAVYVDGKKVEGTGTERGVVFQQYALFPWLTVIKNVMFGLKLKGMSNEEARETAMKYLKKVGLEEFADSYPKELSGGMKQRVAIARALATNPKLLLLDEPAAGMNPNETAELMNTVRSVRDQFGIAILLIEHDMNFVMGICEEITVLDYGRVIARGDGKAIRNNPKVIAAYLGGD